LIKQLMETLVLSQLDYCSVIWSNTSEYNLNRLKVAQNKAAHIVLNCSYRTRVCDMLNMLNWLPVKCRLHYSLFGFARNVITTKTPVILFNNFKFSQDGHDYDYACQSSAGKCILPGYRTGAGQG